MTSTSTRTTCSSVPSQGIFPTSDAPPGSFPICCRRTRNWRNVKDAGGIVLGQADTSIFRILARKPAIGDFDGDGTSDLTIYRPSDGGWYTKRSTQGFSNAGASFFQWGLSTDIPLKATSTATAGPTWSSIARRTAAGTSATRRSATLNTPWAYFQWGLSGDIPIAGDFDGDGRTDLAVYRPSDGGWYIRYSSLGYATNQWAYFQWGLSTDVPIAGDFDGDGRTDLAVYRPSDGGWYIRYSSLATP